MAITALTDLTKLPNRSMDQQTFDNAMAALVLNLPLRAQQENELAANLNLIAAGGGYSIPYTVDLSSTADADPGSGFLRFNAATQNAATAIYVDLIGSNQADFTSILDQIDASTSTVKGQLRIVKMTDASKFLTYSVTARTTATGYRKLTLVNIGGSAASPFVAGDGVLLHFTRTGDRGDVVTGVLHLRDEKASGTSGGSSTGNVQRTLNTVKRNTMGATVSGNNFILQPGNYRLQASAPGYGGYHQIVMSTPIGSMVGTSAYGGNGSSASVINPVEFVLTSAGTFQLGHYTSMTGGANDLGMPASRGFTEVYAEVFVEKLA